jgi:CubicO group peptidase (beta-lactamase class C family)
MQNLLKSVLLVLFFCGCYATTDKYQLKRDASTAPVIPAVLPPSLEKNEFRKIFEAADDFYESTLKPSRFNGGILIAKKGQIVFEKYNGYQNHWNKDMMDSTTSFHLASVSKTFTGMAVLKLWEEGKLGLNDDVSYYLAGFPFAGVTIKTLLNHRSGLPNYVHFMEQLGWDKKKVVQNEDILKFMIEKKDKLNVARPDKRFAYSNTNYALLALIIEKVSGLSFAAYLQESFFIPLGMNHTFVFSLDRAKDVLPSYNWKNQQEAFTYLDAVNGDKNIYSTPRDLLKWDYALTYGNIFKQATLDSAYTGYSFEKPGIKNYGLGWRMYQYPNGKKIIYHNGWWHGNNTVFSRLTEDSATVIVLGNKYNRRIYDAKKLFSVFDGYSQDAPGDE